MSKFTVIGAGMAGLFAGAILRDECAEIIEAFHELPNNHSALLRFRSPIVGDAVNIPFQQVQVMKAVASIGNPVADAISYSLKTNGSASLRSIVSAQGTVETRYVAPEDFVARLASKVTAPIAYGKSWEPSETEGPIISTMPMPALMQDLGYDRIPNFQSIIGYTCQTRLVNSDVCATIYFPDRSDFAYRASITRDRLIIEYAFPGMTERQAKDAIADIAEYPKMTHTHISKILSHFGLTSQALAQKKPEFKLQPYAKILPIADDDRKRFMFWASEKHNIFSFGRFATWRPGLMMDDLVQDLRVITRIANGGGSNYDVKKGRKD